MSMIEGLQRISYGKQVSRLLSTRYYFMLLRRIIDYAELYFLEFLLRHVMGLREKAKYYPSQSNPSKPEAYEARFYLYPASNTSRGNPEANEGEYQT